MTPPNAPNFRRERTGVGWAKIWFSIIPVLLCLSCTAGAHRANRLVSRHLDQLAHLPEFMETPAFANFTEKTYTNRCVSPNFDQREPGRERAYDFRGSATRVAEYYIQRLQGAGWSTETDSEPGNGIRTVSFKKDQGSWNAAAVLYIELKEGWYSLLMADATSTVCQPDK